MNLKEAKRFWPAAVSLLLIVLLIAYHSLGFSARSWNELQDTRMEFPGGKTLEGEMYGVMNNGPALTLPGGKYVLSWDIESDGANEIRLETTNYATLTPSVIRLEPGHAVGSAQIHAIDELYDLQVLVDYQAGSYIRVNGLHIAGGACTDSSFTLGFILLAIAVLNILWVRGWLTPDRRAELIVLAGAVLLASIPALKANLNTGHDFTFHVDRLLNMLNALRTGQFPARLGAYMQNRYGAVSSIYYPELFLYIPAGMMLCGASLIYSMHVFMIGINLVSALSMRYCAGRLLRSSHAGMLASLLYTLSIYRLMDLYTRFSIGEVLAMAFIPLFISALYDVIFGDKRKWKLLALSAMAIYQSHLISTVICALAAVAVCALFIGRIIRERRLTAILLAAVTALLLCLYALVPLYTHSQNGVETSMMVRWTPYHLLAPAQLFLDSTIPDAAASDQTLKDSAIVLGLPLVVGVLSAMLGLAKAPRRTFRENTALLFLVFGAGFTLMTTTLFPWERLTRIVNLVGYIQFPWRLLAMASVCFSIAGGYGLMKLMEDRERESLMQVAVFALCAAMALPLLTQEVRKEDYLAPNRVSYWDMLYGDYTLGGTEVRGTLDRTVHTSGEMTMQDYEKVGTRITARVEAKTDAQISVPLFAFAGYAAEINDQRVEICRGENNRLTIDLPAGTSGELVIWYEGMLIWRIADGISLLTALALLGAALAGRRARAAA